MAGERFPMTTKCLNLTKTPTTQCHASKNQSDNQIEPRLRSLTRAKTGSLEGYSFTNHNVQKGDIKKGLNLFKYLDVLKKCHTVTKKAFGGNKKALRCNGLWAQDWFPVESPTPMPTSLH
ncbi:hypothetical protein CEK25_011306 [Fusarium fujikuroi]|nr:hypothetical protein CEK25_011306 [Fusarium fujikuroi]